MAKSLAEKMRIAAGGKPRPTPANNPRPQSLPGQVPPEPGKTPPIKKPVVGQLPPKKSIKVKKKKPPHVSDR